MHKSQKTALFYDNHAYNENSFNFKKNFIDLIKFKRSVTR